LLLWVLPSAPASFVAMESIRWEDLGTWRRHVNQRSQVPAEAG
jgi:hypothetical protein